MTDRNDEPVRWQSGGRRNARWLACAVATQAVLAGLLGAAYVQQAGRPPTVVAVAADGQVWAGERQPFRPNGRMIEAWLRRVVGTLAIDPVAAFQEGWVEAVVAQAWDRAGDRSHEVTWRELRVIEQGPDGLVVDLRLGWPTGVAGWADERRVRLRVARVGASPHDPMGLRIVESSWLDADEYNAAQRDELRRRRLLGEGPPREGREG